MSHKTAKILIIDQLRGLFYFTCLGIVYGTLIYKFNDFKVHEEHLQKQQHQQRRQISYDENYNYYLAMGYKNLYQKNPPPAMNMNNNNPSLAQSNNQHVLNNYYFTFTKRRITTTKTTTTTTTTTTPSTVNNDYELLTTDIPTTIITPQVMWWSRFNYIN